MCRKVAWPWKLWQPTFLQSSNQFCMFAPVVSELHDCTCISITRLLRSSYRTYFYAHLWAMSLQLIEHCPFHFDCMYLLLHVTTCTIQYVWHGIRCTMYIYMPCMERLFIVHYRDSLYYTLEAFLAQQNGDYFITGHLADTMPVGLHSGPGWQANTHTHPSAAIDCTAWEKHMGNP